MLNLSIRPAADVMIAKFEPSTSMFATTGRVCKLVSSYHVVSDDKCIVARSARYAMVH